MYIITSAGSVKSIGLSLGFGTSVGFCENNRVLKTKQAIERIVFRFSIFFFDEYMQKK